MAFSPDGQRLATGGEENTVKLWDVQTGKWLQTLSGHNGDIYAVAFSPEDALLKAKEKDCREVFIAGGQQIYNAYLPVATKIYITRVHAVLEGDAFFPAIDEKEWKKVYELNFSADEKHAYAYSFQTWVRV